MNNFNLFFIYISDHCQLAEILTQSPFTGKAVKLATKLTEEDLNYMQAVARERFDKIMNALRSMPRTLLLVVRLV